MQKLHKKVESSKQTVQEFCNTLFVGYEHGIKMIEKNTGQKDFVITGKMIDAPAEELEKLIKQSYQKT